MGNGLAKLVFQPPPSSYGRDPNLRWLTTSTGDTIPAFYIHRENAKFTLLFSHGNAEDLGLIIRYFREVTYIMNVSVFAYEYSGYGMSSGQPQEAAVYTNVVAAFKYLRDELRIPWTQIIPYGRSIGTAPSVYLATQVAVRGIVLQSPMVSIYRIPFHLRFTLPGDVFVNIDKIGDVRCPVFIIHGTRDEIVPCWHGQQLYEACAKKGNAYLPYVVDGADHNNLEQQAGDDFYNHFKRFLQHLEDTPVSDKLRRQAESG
jgi:fermentation-respiration switch protein FrsA (DUF1100 family)